MSHVRSNENGYGEAVNLILFSFKCSLSASGGPTDPQQIKILSADQVSTNNKMKAGYAFDGEQIS